MLVMRGDSVVFEEYQNGHREGAAWPLYSGTKSFNGVMLAAAIEDKLISGFDEKVSDTITEWRSDKQKAAITIRQLLSLTSGIDSGPVGQVPSYREAIDRSVRYAPGTHFQYGPAPFQIFGELMSRKLRSRKLSVMDYLTDRILKPIGIKVSNWQMKDGQPMLPQGASLSAREWAKYGLFLLKGGKWNGKQIVSRSLIAELVKGSKTNPAYGISFWLNHAGSLPRGRTMSVGDGDEPGQFGLVDGFLDLFMAAGAGKQRLYIIPSLDMVVVRQGQRSAFNDNEFLSLLLGKHSN